MILESKVIGHTIKNNNIIHEIKPISFDGTIIKYVGVINACLLTRKLPINTKVLVKLKIVPIIHDIIT